MDTVHIGCQNDLTISIEQAYILPAVPALFTRHAVDVYGTKKNPTIVIYLIGKP